MSNDKDLEQEIQEKGLTAPRITPDAIDSVIALKEFHQLTGTLTVCVLTLKNGFTVTGESACASPENFNQEIGCKIAFENAREKVWMLEGYLLKEKLSSVENKVLNIAEICHEVNKSYCESLGDASQVSWCDAPPWQVDSACLGVELHLNDHSAGPQASHESWMKQKVSEGWVYGEKKDPELKTHHCLVPFSELPKEQQAKDYIFRSIVVALDSIYGDKK